MKLRANLATLSLCAVALTAFAGVEQTVTDLLPKLAAAQVEDRYAAQMDLQHLALNAARPGAESERAELAGILATKAADPAVPQPARVWVVRQLEHIGAAESVAALAGLLEGQDAELKECARRALEKNPAPAAGDKLRAALKKGGATTWTVGLIQSLGERRDSGSVRIISDLLVEIRLVPKPVADAALSALGKIADPKAIAFLQSYYRGASAEAANDLVVAGNRLLSTGDKAAAKNLFSLLYLTAAAAQAYTQPAAPVQIRSAALIGWAAADPNSVRPVVEDALRQSQPELQFAAVSAATVAYGQAGVSAALAPLLPKLSPTAKVYVLRVLDASAEREIIAAVSDPETVVQLAAFERLGQIGSAASVPVLFQAAASGSPSAQKAAAAALARISGPGAGVAIAKGAGQGDAKSRAAAIGGLAQRNDPAAAPVLLQYAAESDPEVSGAACAALAKVGTDNELEGLIRLALAGKTPGADAALQAVASRAQDKSVAAQKLIALTRTAEPQRLASLFEVLAMLGGKEALAAISTSAGSSNAEVKDSAIRALANWQEFVGVKPLLVIAFDPSATSVHRVLALRAVARLVKSSDRETAAARLEAVRAGMKAATRDEDKKLLLSAIASVPDKQAAEMIKPFLSNPKFREEAGLAGVELARALRKPDNAASRDLAQAVKNAAISEEITQKAEALIKKR